MSDLPTAFTRVLEPLAPTQKSARARGPCQFCRPKLKSARVGRKPMPAGPRRRLSRRAFLLAVWAGTAIDTMQVLVILTLALIRAAGVIASGFRAAYDG